MKARHSISLLAEFRESFLMAMTAIAAHKLRSALTLLGVLVGVFSIIVVMTALSVMQSFIESKLSMLGANTVWIRKWPVVNFGGPRDFLKYSRRANFTYAQCVAVRDRATMAGAVGIETMLWAGQATSHYGESAPTSLLIGATPGNFPARGWVVAEGRGLLETDVDSRRDVCVLGADLAKSLYPFGSAIGQEIKLNGIDYTIVGVLDGGGSGFGGFQNNFAVIPLTTGLGRFGRTWRSLDILVQARDQASSEDTIEQVRGILRAARKVEPGKEDDFEIFSNDSLISQFRKVTLAIRVTVGVISSIALLAAGIGIMNIMLVSVTERTREIGIRRAVGAKKRNITTQFILEAIMLCEVGGVIGVALGILGGNLAALYLKLPAKIPFDWAAFGLIICSLVGIIFGSYPAIKAANLDPIESLRYE